MSIKNINFTLLFIFTLTLSGCFLFGTKGIFDKSNYKIVKLEIDNRVILSPQELAYDAKGRLGEGNFSLNYNASRMKTSRIDSINAAFEELRAQHSSDDVGTPLSELAAITLESTFNLDRSQDMIYGKAGCNDYTAKFFWQDNTKIVVSGAASTRKACTPKEVAEFQNNFIRNLDGIYVVAKLTNRKGYVLNNGKLRIYVR